jgi:hypothetical protein
MEYTLSWYDPIPSSLIIHPHIYLCMPYNSPSTEKTSIVFCYLYYIPSYSCASNRHPQIPFHFFFLQFFFYLPPMQPFHLSSNYPIYQLSDPPMIPANLIALPSNPLQLHHTPSLHSCFIFLLSSV